MRRRGTSGALTLAKIAGAEPSRAVLGTGERIHAEQQLCGCRRVPRSRRERSGRDRPGRRAGRPDAVAALLDNTGFLAVSPKLGANPVGEAIANKFANRAAGMGDSYAQALRNLYTQYDQAEHAILEAMSRYEDFDSSSAQSFTGQL